LSSVKPNVQRLQPAEKRSKYNKQNNVSGNLIGSKTGKSHVSVMC